MIEENGEITASLLLSGSSRPFSQARLGGEELASRFRFYGEFTGPLEHLRRPAHFRAGSPRRAIRKP
jgi:hypothetical protein